MHTTEIARLFEQNWSVCRYKVRDISNSLVDSDVEMFSFDKICGEIYKSDKKPASVDAVRIFPKYVELIEFKSGFKQKISKDDFIEDQPICQTTGVHCKEYEDYMELFFDKQEMEREELLRIIYLKAIESYITFEKHILPLLSENGKSIRFKYTVVIDEQGIDYMVETLNKLGKVKRKSDDVYEKIKKIVRKIINVVDCNKQPYYYQDYSVMSATEFLEKLQK